MLDDPTPDDDLWPRQGDDPFEIGAHSRLIACLNFSHDMWVGYVGGFKRLADLGVAQIEETGRSHDFLVYPIVFSYRHHLELALKMILRDARMLLERPDEPIKTHKLLALWTFTEPLLREISDDISPYGAVRDCLARFDEMDASSESFRYPVGNDGQPSIPDVRRIDLGQMRSVVERVSFFLDCVGQDVSARLDAKLEMEQAYRDAYG